MQVRIIFFFAISFSTADGTNVLSATNLLSLLIMLPEKSGQAVCVKKLYHSLLRFSRRVFHLFVFSNF